ncbi:UNVERIFIED_CONTAM: hypothetical protein FKN15_056574 [Acipenser sinensis]
MLLFIRSPTNKKDELSDAEKLFQVHAFEIFQKELNESENSVFHAIHGLQTVLQGVYKDVVNMKESSRQRLEALREAAIKEEQEFVELMAAEKHQEAALKNMQQQSKSLSILDELLEDVWKAADRLEEEIEEHAFDDNKLDIVTVVILSLPCGWLCTVIVLPTVFGYIICGVLLGPSGLNSIKVWKISVQGPCCMTFLMVAFGLLWGQVLRIRPAQTVFISTCLSLSSTPLVSRFLSGSARGEKEGEIDYSSVLLGMLVMQDVQLSLFIAVMPTLIQAGGSNYNSVFMEILSIFILVGQILFSLAAVLLICVVIKAYLIGPYYRKLHAECKGNKEILVLGVSAFIFAMLTFFIAGLVLSLILPKSSQCIKWIVSAGLAQVNEFSFILGSRARRAGIISREAGLSFTYWV